jgi:hypothetical protein
MRYLRRHTKQFKRRREWGFDGECGSTLVWYDTSREEIGILVGSMDDIPASSLEITDSVSSLLTELTVEFV